MMAAVRAWWAARPAREQRTMLLGAGALAMVLVVFGGILPLLDQHTRLMARLPELRETTAALERQEDEAVILRRRVGGPATLNGAGLSSRNPIIDTGNALTAAGLRGAADSVTASPEGGVEIQLARVSFDAFMSWYGQQRRSSGLVLRTLDADALDDPGMVRLKAVLAAPGGRAGPH